MARFPSQKCEETNQEYALIDWEKFSELVSRRPMIKQLRDRSWVSDVVRRIQHIYLPFLGSITTSILLVLLILQYLYFLWCIIMLHPWPETYLRNKGQSHYCLLSNLFLSLCIEWNIISIIYLTLQPTPSFTTSFLIKGLGSFVLLLFSIFFEFFLMLNSLRV